MVIDQPERDNTPATLPQLVEYCKRQYPSVRALFAPHVKPILEMTYSALADEVATLGAGLLEIGVTAGQHVALFSDNRPRWIMADLAITGIGAVDVPRGSDTATPEFQFILEHSESSGAFIQDKRLFDRLNNAGALSALQFVVMLDDADVKAVEGPQVYKYSDLLEKGTAPEAYHTAAAKVTPATLASIVYTSGTTGSPKGVMLSHGNLMTQPLGVELNIGLKPGEILLSVLPSWHAYERAVEYFGIYHGLTITYSDKKYIREDMIKLAPHLFPCVPRIWEMVYKAVQSKTNAAPENKKKLFQKFMDIGQQYIEARRVAMGLVVQKQSPTAGQKNLARAKMAALYPLFKLGDKLVYSKVRQVTGGRMRVAISGGGSLAPYLDDFFEIVGVPIMNGYGLTETSPVLTVRRGDHNVRGTVGLPMVHTQVQLRAENGTEVNPGEAGEIWARGPQIMIGYYKNPEATEKVLSENGWFRTGDLGWYSASGDLVISGRAKDTIVLSSGENVEPDLIEDACRKSRLVQQIVLVGQDQKTLGALVVPDFANLAEAVGLPSDSEPAVVVGHADAAKVVRKSLAEAMGDGQFKASESISKVHLLAEPFSERNGLLTNTMKIKRNKVLDHYEAEISEMFA